MGFFNRKKEENEDNGKRGFFHRLRDGLKKTRQGFIFRVKELFNRFSGSSEDFYEELEEILIQADVGVETTMKLVGKLRQRVSEEKIIDSEKLDLVFQEELMGLMPSPSPIQLEKGLNIFMIVGVNGSGKTTTIAKLALRFKEEKKKVLLVAGDTFRAAAIDQLKMWGQRVGVDVISQKEGSDASAVVFDGIHAAFSRGVEALIIDTAGRLQTQKNLMEELKKMRRIINREGEGAKISVLLVLDATTGQNALSQANIFHKDLDLDGLILTKLDGTAKGGMIISIMDYLHIPVKMIGVGEKAQDLQDFDPQLFARALFEE